MKKILLFIVYNNVFQCIIHSIFILCVSGNFNRVIYSRIKKCFVYLYPDNGRNG